MVNPLENYKIINVVRRALSDIDPRLINHGERVAFLAKEIANCCPSCRTYDPDRLFELCARHDIGAYKTDEIDRMITFETSEPMRHALYGYLFLKHTSALGESAQAILYHHTDFGELKTLSCPYEKYASIIHLADRVDLLLESRASNLLGRIQRLSGSSFDPVLVSALEKAMKEHDIAQRIQSGSYMDDVTKQIRGMCVPGYEATEYLRMLVFAIDFRSEYTVTHTANTTSFSLLLGERMGLTEETLSKLSLGAFLHDIGKIATPVEILEKPGRLSAEEMKVMRQHVITSERILRGVVDDDICEIAIRHHEKLNGTGYPKGLSASDLTLPQRIVAVADVLSALTGKRSYKEPFDKETTLSILMHMRDEGELDSGVCNCLASDYDEILRQAVVRSRNVVSLYETVLQEYETLRRDFECAG